MTYCKEVNFVSYGPQTKGAFTRGKTTIEGKLAFVGEGETSYQAAFDSFEQAKQAGYNVGSELDKRLMAQENRTSAKEYENLRCYFVIQLIV